MVFIEVLYDVCDVLLALVISFFNSYLFLVTFFLFHL